jgi:hypothetical protein
MADKLTDVRFSYRFDNPFTGYDAKTSMNKLRDIIEQNPEDWRDVDWLTDSRTYNAKACKEAFGRKVKPLLEDNKVLYEKVIGTLTRINQHIEEPFTDELAEYISGASDAGARDNDNQSEDADNQSEESPQQIEYAEPRVRQEQYIRMDRIPQTSMTFKSNSDLYSYDARPGKTLSYAEVCELTLNIARSQLQDIIQKDDSVVFAENRERNRLITELNKYMKNAEIATKLNLKTTDLSIPQLQQMIEQAKELHETLKVTHIIEKGFDLFDLGYTFIFPEGIKIPKTNKAVKLGNVSKTFKQLLFDRNSPLNIAFKNILEKHNHNYE